MMEISTDLQGATAILHPGWYRELDEHRKRRLTMMYCAELGVMDQETAYLDLLPKAGSFALDSNRLIISDKSGNAILTFVKTTPAHPCRSSGPTGFFPRLTQAMRYQRLLPAAG